MGNRRRNPLINGDPPLAGCFLRIVAMGAAAREIGDVGDPAAVGFVPEDVDMMKMLI